jgi:hypothetical protein
MNAYITAGPGANAAGPALGRAISLLSRIAEKWMPVFGSKSCEIQGI